VNPLEIPDIVIKRLPLYLRTLNLLVSEGQAVTSSQELGDRLGISSTQIRKDLSYFGEFGKQGTGYDVCYLRDQLGQILQVSRRWSVALVGAGDLGHAILRHSGFQEGGFAVVAVFDRDEQKVGAEIGKLRVEDIARLREVVQEQGIRIGIIAVPANEAQRVADALVKAGIRAVLSYASVTLSLPSNVRVHYIDPVVGLQAMTYYLNPEQT